MSSPVTISVIDSAAITTTRFSSKAGSEMLFINYWRYLLLYIHIALRPAFILLCLFYSLCFIYKFVVSINIFCAFVCVQPTRCCARCLWECSSSPSTLHSTSALRISSTLCLLSPSGSARPLNGWDTETSTRYAFSSCLFYVTIKTTPYTCICWAFISIYERAISFVLLLKSSTATSNPILWDQIHQI